MKGSDELTITITRGGSTAGDIIIGTRKGVDALSGGSLYG